MTQLSAHARMIIGDGGITNPLVQLIITPHETEVFEKVGLVDVHLNGTEARLLGLTLLGLASETDSQGAYITALRATKENEEEIMELVGEAVKLIEAKRGAGL